ncbi:MAG: hypothetical protein AB7O96_06495 [Pseudobdellovibrionaceae bacterium]
MSRRSQLLKNSLQNLDLSREDLNKILDWYDGLHANEIVFPKELSTRYQFGIALSQKVLLRLALRKLFIPFTLPKVHSQLLKSFATQGYELILTDDLIEEVRANGSNPSEITAVTGFKKCVSR